MFDFSYFYDIVMYIYNNSIMNNIGRFYFRCYGETNLLTLQVHLLVYVKIHEMLYEFSLLKHIV